MSNTPTINLEDAPVWDYTLGIRGMALPMTSPMDAKDMPPSPVPSQQEIDAMTKRWPGLFVWLWRAIVGGPRIDRGDLPQDGGAQHTRDMCLVILGDEHHELVDSLSTGECVQLARAYMGAQAEYFHRVEQFASSIVSEATRKKGDADQTPRPDSNGMTKLMPGGNHPIQLNARRHPNITDGSGE